jgi:hypothetical protein
MLEPCTPSQMLLYLGFCQVLSEVRAPGMPEQVSINPFLNTCFFNNSLYDRSNGWIIKLFTSSPSYQSRPINKHHDCFFRVDIQPGCKVRHTENKSHSSHTRFAVYRCNSTMLVKNNVPYFQFTYFSCPASGIPKRSY